MSHNNTSLKTPLAKVRGLGAAGDGVGHWWWQRLTAIALVPLSLWFVSSMLKMLPAGRAELALWFSSPVVVLAVIAFFAAMLYHAYLGVRVIIEDYVHCHAKQLAFIIILRFAAIIGWMCVVLAAIKLHFAPTV